ncbi:hypothetical protein RFI_18489, partial [Reticulomyxa filosa]
NTNHDDDTKGSIFKSLAQTLKHNEFALETTQQKQQSYQVLQKKKKKSFIINASTGKGNAKNSATAAEEKTNMHDLPMLILDEDDENGRFDPDPLETPNLQRVQSTNNDIDHLQEHSFAVTEKTRNPDSEIGSFIRMCQQAPRLQLFNAVDSYLIPVHDQAQNSFYSGAHFRFFFFFSSCVHVIYLCIYIE